MSIFDLLLSTGFINFQRMCSHSPNSQDSFDDCPLSRLNALFCKILGQPFMFRHHQLLKLLTLNECIGTIGPFSLSLAETEPPTRPYSESADLRLEFVQLKRRTALPVSIEGMMNLNRERGTFFKADFLRRDWENLGNWRLAP